MLIISNAQVEWIEPGIFENLVHARVTHHGARASIWRRLDDGRMDQVDCLDDVTYKEGDEWYTFTGKSQQLVQQVGVAPEDAIVNLRVKGEADCPSC